jgi:putative ABC transport system permease protein
VLGDTMSASLDELAADTEALTGEAAPAQEARGDFISALRAGPEMLGLVALAVAAFGIHSAFAITAAERTRESALLRVLGASRRQILGAAAAEALVVGAVATLAGTAGGIGSAALLTTLFSGFGTGLPAQAPVLTWSTALIVVPVGPAVTLLSALSPAVRASRVPPMAALRETSEEGTAPSAPRVVIGVALGAVAGGAVVTGALIGLPAVTGMGAAMALAVLVVLGPAASRLAAVVVGGPAARLRGAAGRLARDNAARDPRRTAGAATVLMAGVGMVTLLTVVVGSMRASLRDRDAYVAVRSEDLTAGSGDLAVQTKDLTVQTEDLAAFLGIGYGMLAPAIVIAVLGIAGTLALSVHERTRELGLLRAVGATRPQIRSMVRWESVIVALFGTAGGIGLGLFLGWAFTRTLDVPFAAAPLRLGLIVLVGAVAGMLAAIGPARRAAARGVLESIAMP